MAQNDRNPQPESSRTGSGKPVAARGPLGRRGFTLVEVLIAIAVVALLVVIMLPAIAMARASAKKLVCASQLRQLSLCMQLYADDNDGLLVESGFVSARTGEYYMPESANTLRTVSGHWDGIGKLNDLGYMDAPSVYYCPGHPGELVFDNYADLFAMPFGEIVAPYHYRAGGSEGLTRTYFLPPSRALVTDLLGVETGLNHMGGTNVLRANAGVTWVDDQTGRQASSASSKSTAAAETIERQWEELDRAGRSFSTIPLPDR